MPIYEYRCQSCSHEVEVMQKVADPPLVDCPSCQRPELRKKLSASAFRLSGGGWYETDFKTGDKKRNLAGEGAAAGDVKPAGDSKSGSDSATPAASGGGATAAATAAS
jgi:putative FmdB family regulatory protein